jgi:hypothetical protein
MSVVRLQFEYRPSSALYSSSRTSILLRVSLRNRALGVEKGAAHELKPSPFPSSIRVRYSVRIPIFPLYLSLFVLLIRTSPLRRISDFHRIPIGNRYLTCTHRSSNKNISGIDTTQGSWCRRFCIWFNRLIV